MAKEFNSLDEMQKYYDEKSNTYIFKEDGRYIDIVFNFNLDVGANIDAGDINALNIKAMNIDSRDIICGNIDVINIKALDIKSYNIHANNIDACDIDALDIKAGNIEAVNIEALDVNYFAVCFAYNNIKCKSIKGSRKNAKHFVLDGKLEIEEWKG